jgi:hypothetical protein
MRAEFDFIIKTGKPSLEYDVCRSIDEFKRMLSKKCGQENTHDKPSSGGIFSSIKGYVFGSSATEEVKDYSKKADTSMHEYMEPKSEPKSSHEGWNDAKGKRMSKKEFEEARRKEDE